MKSWLAKMRISAALDSGRQPPAWLQRWVRRSRELRRFEQAMMTLDQALKQTVPKPEAPASLHHSIMQAVPGTSRLAATEPRLTFLHWAPLPALVLIMLLGAWWFLHRPPTQPAPSAQTLAAAATALELGGQIPETVPPVVVAPLSDELERLHRDLDSTAQFLLASLP